MVYIAVILLAWMLLSAFVCVVVCMAAGRFGGFRQPAVAPGRPEPGRVAARVDAAR